MARCPASRRGAVVSGVVSFWPPPNRLSRWRVLSAMRSRRGVGACDARASRFEFIDAPTTPSQHPCARQPTCGALSDATRHVGVAACADAGSIEVSRAECWCEVAGKSCRTEDCGPRCARQRLQRIFIPSADSASSTASCAVALRTSSVGLISTRSSEASRPESAMTSITICASR